VAAPTSTGGPAARHSGRPSASGWARKPPPRSLITGIVADLLSLQAAIWVVAGITALSGLVVAVRMYETHHPATAGGRLEGT